MMMLMSDRGYAGWKAVLNLVLPVASAGTLAPQEVGRYVCMVSMHIIGKNDAETRKDS